METVNQQNIKLIREKVGLSQDEVAKYLGIKRELISYYETGSRQAPLEILERLADFYGVDLADLLSDNKDVIITNLAFALRVDDNKLDIEDLKNIASFRKVVLNYLKMIELNK